MAFSEEELAFLALIFIFALVIWMLGRNGNTSTAKKTKKEEKGTGKGKLSKQVRKEADGECFYWHFQNVPVFKHAIKIAYLILEFALH